MENSHSRIVIENQDPAGSCDRDVSAWQFSETIVCESGASERSLGRAPLLSEPRHLWDVSPGSSGPKPRSWKTKRAAVMGAPPFARRLHPFYLRLGASVRLADEPLSIVTLDISGQETFQELAIAEVQNQGQLQRGSQSCAEPGIGPTGGTGLARSAR